MDEERRVLEARVDAIKAKRDELRAAWLKLDAVMGAEYADAVFALVQHDRKRRKE